MSSYSKCFHYPLEKATFSPLLPVMFKSSLIFKTSPNFMNQKLILTLLPPLYEVHLRSISHIIAKICNSTNGGDTGYTGFILLEKTTRLLIRSSFSPRFTPYFIWKSTPPLGNAIRRDSKFIQHPSGVNFV